MATRIWNGNAAAVAQVDKYTPANVEVNDIFGLTMGTTPGGGGKDVSYTSTAATVAAAVAGLVAAWNGSTELEHKTLTAAASTGNDYLKLTADSPGVPFTVNGSAENNSTGGVDNQTLTRAAVTANAGPNVFDDAENWEGGIAPTTGDDIVFEASVVPCKYGLAQTFKPASITVKQSFADPAQIGLPRTNADGYPEYLDRYLTFVGSTASGGTQINIGQGEGNGSGRILLDASSGQFTANVYNKGSRAETGIPCVLLNGSHADNVLNVNKGDVGLALFAGESGALDELNVGYIDRKSSDAKVICGSNLAISRLTQYGGQVELHHNCTDATVIDGELGVNEDAAIDTLAVRGGSVKWRSSGTIGDAQIEDGAVLDFREDARDRTVSNATVHKGGAIYDPAATVTWTQGVDLDGCGLEDVTLELGKHRTWTPSII